MSAVLTYIFPQSGTWFRNHAFVPSLALFQNENDGSGEDSDDDSGTDHFSSEKSGTQLQRCERQGGGNSNLPDTFQTSNLLFYDRFKAYQDYMLGKFGKICSNYKACNVYWNISMYFYTGDCKPSEVKAFISDYLEKALEPCDWLAIWRTDVFDVVVEVKAADGFISVTFVAKSDTH